jgi:hypothetical protein
MPREKLPVAVIQKVLERRVGLRAGGNSDRGRHSIDTLEPIYGLWPSASSTLAKSREQHGEVPGMRSFWASAGVGILSAVLRRGS